MNGLKYLAAFLGRHAGMRASKLFIWSMGAYAAAIWLAENNNQLSTTVEAETVAARVIAVMRSIAHLDIVGVGNQLDGMLNISATMPMPDRPGFLLMTGLARLCLLGFMILTVCVAACAAVVLCLAVAQRIIRRSQGARFASDREVAAARNPNGAAFGHYRGAPLLLHTDKHVLIMASTRSGKGISLIIPHLLRYPGSAFVLDPKGENARATGRQRALLNRRVHYLDPFGISGMSRARFNPLSRFTPDNMEAESKALAAALVLGERDHWTASAQQLLAAFILYVFTAADIPAGSKDLNAVRRLLLSDVAGTLKAMTGSDAAGGLLADLAASFLNTPEREFGSIVSTAQRETEILDNPFIAACLAAAGDGDEVDFTSWHRETMTVYLCLSAPKFPVFNRWLRLVLTSALDEMTDQLNPPRLPVCFMLDELATLGPLAAVENAIGLAAGYGVQLVTVFQDVAQMRDLYKGRWASFIGNAGIRALFNLDDYDTARYWSDFIGGRMMETRSESRDVIGITQGQTTSEAFRPVLSPDEIMLRYASGRMLVLPQGSRPIETERVPYFRDRTLTSLWDDPRVSPPGDCVTEGHQGCFHGHDRRTQDEISDHRGRRE